MKGSARIKKSLMLQVAIKAAELAYEKAGAQIKSRHKKLGMQIFLAHFKTDLQKAAQAFNVEHKKVEGADYFATLSRFRIVDTSRSVLTRISSSDPHRLGVSPQSLLDALAPDTYTDTLFSPPYLCTDRYSKFTVSQKNLTKSELSALEKLMSDRDKLAGDAYNFCAEVLGVMMSFPTWKLLEKNAPSLHAIAKNLAPTNETSKSLVPVEALRRVESLLEKAA